MRRAIVLFAVGVFAVVAPPAGAAEFGFVPDGVALRMLNAEGAPESRAGSHPDRLQIEFALIVEDTGTTPRDLAIELPPGLSSNVSAVPDCPLAQLEEGLEACPEESQIGVMDLGFVGFGDLELPFYQMEPPADQGGTVGSLPGLGTSVEMETRPDSGVTMIIRDVPHAPLTKGHIELWGVPADHQQGTVMPRRAFLTAPTRCGPLSVTIRARSWQDGAPWLSSTAETAVPLSGCEDLAFEPRLAMQLSNPRADSPTGLEMDLTLPESSDPDGLASAQLRDATFELPEGVTISPGTAAGGSPTCSDAQFGLGTNSEVTCPAGSKVGTVEIASPSMREPLGGTIYAGEERPGERFRTLVAASGAGTVTKFVGEIEVDPATGRLSTRLSSQPQVAIERLTMSIDGGAGPLLATPIECGAFHGIGHFVPYGDGPPVDSVAPVSIDAGPDGSACPSQLPFSPQLTATGSRSAAGKPTAISMTLQRRAGEQLPRRFTVTMPSGLSTTMKDVELCSTAEAILAACPPGSRIGSALFEAGSGTSLLGLHGDIFVGDSYRRAPFSLVMTFRLGAGAIDLGAMSVRSALRIDPRNGRITVESDPLLPLVDGISIRFRTMRMTLDRPGMIRNPTSCAPAVFDATVEAGGGAKATATSGLPVTGCKKLGFKPRFEMALTGRSQLHEGGRPGLRFTARLRRGDAALRNLRFSLPEALKFRLGGLGEICSRRDALAQLCGPRARVGVAYARTPTLREALRGSVYVVQPAGDGQPDLWISVAGERMSMSLRGRASVRDGSFVSHLTKLPDMPLSEFSMRLRGGERGALTLALAPCEQGRARPLLSSLFAEGQNGASRKLRLRAKVPCGAAG